MANNTTEHTGGMELTFKQRAAQHAKEAQVVDRGGGKLSVQHGASDEHAPGEQAPFTMHSAVNTGKQAYVAEIDGGGFNSRSYTQGVISANSSRELPENHDNILATARTKAGNPMDRPVEPTDLVDVGDKTMEVRTAVRMGYLFQNNNGFFETNHPNAAREWDKQRARKQAHEEANKSGRDYLEKMGLSRNPEDAQLSKEARKVQELSQTPEGREKLRGVYERLKAQQQEEHEVKPKNNHFVEDGIKEVLSDLSERAGSGKALKEVVADMIENGVTDEKMKAYSSKFKMSPEKFAETMGEVSALHNVRNMEAYDQSYAHTDGVSGAQLIDAFQKQASPEQLAHYSRLSFEGKPGEAVEYVRGLFEKG